MQDTASHGAPKLDNGELRHTLSVHEVEAALVAAGVPRSRRQIIRYCETGLLEAVKVPGPTGAQWYVSPASLPKAIGDLKQWEAQRVGQSSTELDMSNSVALEKPLNNNSDTASHGAPKHAMSNSEHDNQQGSETEPATSRYVQQLEKRVEEKDETILFLQDELKDRRVQISDMKNIIDGQRQLLETINNNVAPVFGALAKLVAPKEEDGKAVTATIINDQGVEAPARGAPTGISHG